MRDPDLIVRAQLAAAELERAWDRWRAMHGLAIDPPPPVSSYVGYSLEEPWGQPRVVFGIDAREAEQLAVLLDRHDCAGPVYASVASLAAARTADPAEARAGDVDHHHAGGRVRVPTQGQPGVAQRERQPEPAQPEPLLGPLEPPQRGDGPRDQEHGPGAGRSLAEEPAAADHDASARREELGPEATQPGPPAFRPRLDSAAYADQGLEPAAVPDEPAQPAESGQAATGWTRASRSGGHALSRQKRAARGAGTRQEGRDS
jgi:hypothetical protein